MTRLRRGLGYMGLAVFATLLAGTAGFVLIEQYPVFDAFYMALITIATVGYSEVHPLSLAGRIFNSVLIFFGVSLLFFAIGLITQAVVQLELGEFFGKRRMKRMIDKLQDHYIVCGYGRVGRGAARAMRQAGLACVVIDRDPDKVEQAVSAGLLALAADSTRDQTLVEAGVTRARGLVAALGTDADNLFVILSAKTLNPMLNVAARAGEEEAEEKLRRAGADTVFAPYTHAGHRLAQALIRPHVLQFLDFTTKGMGLDVVIEQVRVGQGGEFASKSLKQMQIRRDIGVIVLAIRRANGEMVFNPPAEAVIQSGDHLVAMGEPENLRKLEHLLAEVRQ
jgi:voltage-gated potassium channel